MKKIISIILTLAMFISVIYPCESVIAAEIAKNDAITVSREVSQLCMKYDKNETNQIDKSDSSAISIDDRIIVKSKSKINTYDAVEVVYGLGYAFVQFDNSEDAQEAYMSYDEQGYDVQYDKIFSICEESPEDDSGSSDKWAYERLEVDETLSILADTGIKYKDVTVGVIDTGVDYTHELLKDRITRTDYNFSSSGNENDCMDDEGHGTQVAGIIAQCTLDNVSIQPYKLFGSDGKCTTSQIHCLLKYIISSNDKPDVINMSFGIFDPYDEIDTALFKELYNEGITVVAGAGNDATYVDYQKPACIEEFITVSASDMENDRCNFSNFGKTVDIAAPGIDVYSSKLGGGYTKDAGTSFSAPFVSAAAAIVLMQDSSLSPDDISEKIKSSVIPVGKNSLQWCGTGLLNFCGLINQKKLNDVKFNFKGGNYNEPLSLELTCDNDNADIIYTTDLSVPSVNNGNIYSSAIDITERMEIIAVAIDKSNPTLRSPYFYQKYQIIYNADENDFDITDSGEITTYNGNHSGIVVPDKINDIIPTSIGDSCFQGSNITYIELPDTVENILSYAFSESSLESITAEGVNYCAYASFRECHYLNYEYMPNVRIVSGLVFEDCYAMTDFSFKNKLESAGENAFQRTSLQEAIFPKLKYITQSFEDTPCYIASLPKVTHLNGGFRNCFNLYDLYIPNVVKVSRTAFGSCLNLELDDSVFQNITEVDSRGFAESLFEKIDLPNCTKIGDASFIYAQAKVINLPSVTVASGRPFMYTFYLEKLNLDSLESFKTNTGYTFYDPVYLKHLYLPNCTNLPTFNWDQSKAAIDNGEIETSLEFIYAPKATEFAKKESDMRYCDNLKFIFAPNLTSVETGYLNPNSINAIVFPNNNFKLYLSEKFTDYKKKYKNEYNFTIVAPAGSYAESIANEYGYTFKDSASMANQKGRSICTSVAGLRFGFTWDNIDEIESLASDIEYGFIYSQKGAEDLSIDTVDSKTIKKAIANNRIDHGDTTSFNLVISNMPNSYYDREITARAYVCIDGMYFYSNMLKGSFGEVANLVLADDEIDQNTKNAINKLLEA